MLFRKITIVGVGLLGGSVALAARRRGLAAEIAGYARTAAGVADCERQGVTDYATTDLLAAVSRADLVVLSTPLAAMPRLARDLLPALKPGALVTDVGSVKGGTVRGLTPLIAQAGGFFVGSHPMAGAEQTGLGAARAGLFDGAICVLTPTRGTAPAAVRKLRRFWEGLGARTRELTPAAHDRLVSRSSHLPHVAAAALAALVLDPRAPEAQAELCASGFRDTTRIASGSPEMWRDIALENRQELRRALRLYLRGLQRFQDALESGRPRRLEQFFATAKSRRDLWRAQGTGGQSE